MKFNKKVAVLIMICTLLALSIFGCGKVSPDYSNAADFEAALNNGDDLTGKTVSIDVDNFEPQSAFGYDIWAGEHLNFVSSNNPNVKEGDTITVKATEIKSVLGSWIITYEIIK